MNWITEISIDNYRAFAKKEIINITEGNHLLIYGENGSGKSSIYYALKDFFASSFTSSQVNFKLNKFQEENDNKTGNITIGISNNGKNKTYTFAIPNSLSNNNIQKIQLANKVKGFLDYKKMLQVHSIDIPENEQPDVFNLIIYDLLSEYKINDLNGGVTQVSIIDVYNDLNEKIFRRERDPDYEDIFHSEELLNQKLNEIEDSINSPELDEQRYLIYDLLEKYEAIKLLDKFNSELLSVLREVFERVNFFLKTYFKNKLFIDVNFTPISYNKQEDILNESLKLRVKYADTEIDFYQTFLNEARLSSLAICIYLASISVYSENAPTDTLKILYLDDVFIGLDTSNRFPLLEIIKKEFIDKDFQIFISTYDREWFELSRHWFYTKKVQIKSIELFIGDDDDKKPDYPVIINTQSNLEKAETYFKAKDYTAAGNYLRKECEDLVGKILPETYKVNEDGSIIQGLENLLNKLEKLFNDCNIDKPQELLDSVRIYRSALLNPSSHNDLKSSIFRKEVKDAFEIVTNLKKLVDNKPIRTLILGKGDSCFYQNSSIKYSAEIELTENLFVVEYNGKKEFTNHKFKIKKWTVNGVEYEHKGKVLDDAQIDSICSQERTLDDIFKGIKESTQIPIPQNLFTEITTGSKTLYDFLI